MDGWVTEGIITVQTICNRCEKLHGGINQAVKSEMENQRTINIIFGMSKNDISLINQIYVRRFGNYLVQQ